MVSLNWPNFVVSQQYINKIGLIVVLKTSNLCKNLSVRDKSCGRHSDHHIHIFGSILKESVFFCVSPNKYYEKHFVLE